MSVNPQPSTLNQVDIAVDLGVVPPPLPELLTLRQLVETAPAPPPQIIDGVLHQGCKLILGGTSKSNKSWCLLDLAISVASGQPWWGRPCAKMPVVYINFELHVWAVAQRLNALCAARPECTGLGDTLHLWNLRGHNADLSLLRPKLEEQLLGFGGPQELSTPQAAVRQDPSFVPSVPFCKNSSAFDLIILDPARRPRSGFTG